MNLGLILKALMLRRTLRRHDRWSRSELLSYQNIRLKELRKHALQFSPFYQKLYLGKEELPLEQLPIVTKAMLMDGFEDAVTDRRIHLKDVENHLTSLTNDELFLGEYRICGTGGTTGRRGIFPFSRDEWAHIIASYSRTYEWSGVKADLLNWTSVAVVSSKNPLHQSARVGASVGGPWMKVLRIDALEPLSGAVEKLNRFQPLNLIAYASMLNVLAHEQLSGRLDIHPVVVISASEVLTNEIKALVKKAWAVEAYDTYGATETAGLASPCPENQQSHLYEDLVITEVVDQDNRPVPPGTSGSKILVTVLFSRTLPLIRYEMSDCISLSDKLCACGRPYTVMKSIEGRAEDILWMPGIDSKVVAIHPNLFHNALEEKTISEWQVVQQDGSYLEVKVVPANGSVDLSALKERIASELLQQKVLSPKVEVNKVSSISKTIMGKSKLVIAQKRM